MASPSKPSMGLSSFEVAPTIDCERQIVFGEQRSCRHMQSTAAGHSETSGS